jgi:hypothetical protein
VTKITTREVAQGRIVAVSLSTKTNNMKILKIRIFSFLVIFTVLFGFSSCQKRELTESDFCGQKYKIWIQDDPENRHQTSMFVVFNENGMYKVGGFAQDVFQDSLMFYFQSNNISYKWKIDKDTLIMGRYKYSPIIKNDTLKFNGNSMYNWIDYTDFVKLNGDSINPKSRLTLKGFDKLYLEKYHGSLSRTNFDLEYLPRKISNEMYEIYKEFEKNKSLEPNKTIFNDEVFIIQ